jgi:protein phosphatase
MMTIAFGAATDRGLVRAMNEDSLLADPPVFLVADGMGGYQFGDTASAIIVEEFIPAEHTEHVTVEWVMQSFHRADHRIRFGAGGGATVAGMVMVEQDSRSYWLIFNIGDSRVYRFSGGGLEQISVDHSVVQELVDEGRITPADARRHPKRHIITRAVGADEAPRPDFWMVPVVAGERLMLCSDGLSSELDADAISAIVTTTAAPQEIADSLVAHALSAGGRDNVTAVVVDVLDISADPGGAHAVSPALAVLLDESTRPHRWTAESLPTLDALS